MTPLGFPLACAVAVLSAPAFPNIVSITTTAHASGNPSGVMRMALVGKADSLNQLTAAPGCISCWRLMELEYAFGMPVRANGSLYPQGGIFDWMKTNSNATVWDFNIRPGAKWSDGQPITSADINFTFGFGSKYIFGQPTDFIGLSTNVTKVTVINTSETEFTLNKVEPNFGLSLAAQLYYTPVPAHIWQGKTYSSISNFAQDVVSGPFYHTNYDGGTNLVLKANPYYWNGPGVAEIDVTFVSQSTQGPTLLQGNQTDLAQVDPDFVSGFINAPHFGVNIEPDRGILYLEYNISQVPFNNLAFRQAMAYSINTSDIVTSVYKGYATPGISGEGTIPPSAVSWHNPNTARYPYNVTQAKSLLAGQGYKGDSSGNLLYSNGTAVRFKIYTDSDVTTDFLTMQSVANYLRGIGMQISVIAESLSTIAGDYTAGAGDIRSQLVISSNTSPIFGLGFLDIEPGFNIYFPWFVTHPHWILPSSAETQFNSLTNTVNTSTNSTQVQQAVKQIDLLNSQNLPLVVLGYPDTIWVYRTDHLQGFPASGSGAGFDMGAISLDPYTFSQITLATGGPSTPSNTTLLLTVAAVIIIAIAIGVAFLRARRPRGPPSEPSPTA
jgi:peptide/nickel transport system substrate-binding protein